MPAIPLRCVHNGTDTRPQRRAVWLEGPYVAPFRCDAFKQEGTMLTTLLAVLIILWLLGMVGSYTMGGFIHVLLVVAVVLLVVRLFQGRRLAG